MSGSDEGRFLKGEGKPLNMELGDRSQYRYVDTSLSREAISAILDSAATYIFLRTTANPKAIAALSGQTIRTIDRYDSREAYLVMYSASDNPNEKVKLKFSPEVLDDYNDALDKLAVRHLGEKSYASFDLVKTHGVDSGDHLRYTNFYFSWPRIHVVKGTDRVEEFKDLITQLNEDEAYNIIKEAEGQWCYRMGEINFLKKKNIAPLLLEPQQWKIDGETLRTALDFLVPFTVIYEREPSHWDDD
jgi:hypothetical protein